MSKYKSADWSDEMLLDLIKDSDDRSAFAELYGRYWQTLTDAAYQRLKSIEIAQEAVQDIFVKLFLRRAELEMKSNVEAYLKTALKYKIYNIYRSQQIHSEYVAHVMRANNIDASSPLQSLQTKELKEKINHLASQMPDKCKEVFLLSKFENLSHLEISERMGISVSTVKKHITKAMNIMRANLGDYRPDLLIFFLFLQHYS